MKHFVAFFIGVVFLVTGAALLLTPVVVAVRHGGACTLSVPVLVSGVGLLLFAAMIFIPTDTQQAGNYVASLLKGVKT